MEYAGKSAHPPARGSIDVPRPFLYATSAVAGSAVMVVEILGAKILAPFVGTSHFVWTAQIGVTLAALACGYYLGGRLADSKASLGRLYAAILAASVWLTLSVILLKPIAYAFIYLPLAFSSLLSSSILFFVPLALLAMAGPFLLKAITASVEQVGKNSGRLSALSTAGSFAGTATVGYLLIPLFPSSRIMAATAAALALLSSSYFFLWGRKSARGRPFRLWALVAAAAVAASTGGAALGASAYEGSLDRVGRISFEVLETRESAFGLLQAARVKDTPYLYYLNDYLTQNTYDESNGKSVSAFTYLLEGLARAYVPELEDALCIGMGIGIVPRELASEGVRVDVVEINPQLPAFARRRFGLDASAFTLAIGDGRRFLETSGKTYDAVILDAFIGDSSPSHLLSKESFEAVKRALKPGGAVVVNAFADLSGEGDFYANSLYRTMASVFASVRVHGSPVGNAFFVASDRPGLSFAREPDLGGVHPLALSQVKAGYAYSWTPKPGEGIVLTDDYNPLEFRDAANREALRRNLALFMRGI